MKRERQTFILKLINEKEVATQKQLLSFLLEAGFPVTQATISRDIKEMNLIKKKNKQGNVCYHQPSRLMTGQTKRLARLLHQSYQSCEVQENLLVLYTLAGSAPALSKLLMEVYHDVLFTIMSNDDHLLMIGRDAEKVIHIKEDIESLTQQYKEGKHATRTFHS